MASMAGIWIFRVMLAPVFIYTLGWGLTGAWMTIVLDQIAQRTGIKLDIISNSEQRFLDYKSVASKGESFRKILEEL